MNTLTFDVTLFRQQFPEFSNTTTYPDIRLQMYWDQATCYISDCNYGRLKDDCRQLAINLMTAHLTKISTLIANNQFSFTPTGATIDKISISLTPPPTYNAWQWWLEGTEYGKQLLALLQARSVGGFQIGGFPETQSFRRVGGIFF